MWLYARHFAFPQNEKYVQKLPQNIEIRERKGQKNVITEIVSSEWKSNLRNPGKFGFKMKSGRGHKRWLKNGTRRSRADHKWEKSIRNIGIKFLWETNTEQSCKRSSQQDLFDVIIYNHPLRCGNFWCRKCACAGWLNSSEFFKILKIFEISIKCWEKTAKIIKNLPSVYL